MKQENEKVNSEASEPEVAAAQSVESETVKECKAVILPEKAEVEKTIRTSIYASAGVGIVPFGLFNAAAVTASNLYLVRKLSELYGVEFKEGAAKKIVASVIGAGAGTLATPLVESVVGLVPIIGWPLVIGTKPALNAATTYALAQMFITHFERGGSFVGASIDVMKADFTAAFKNSREWLGNKVSGKKTTEAESA